MLASFPAIFLALLLNKYWLDDIPQLFGAVPIVNVGPSAVGSHLVGTMVFALIGYRKLSVAWPPCLVRRTGSCLLDQPWRNAFRCPAPHLRHAHARTVAPDD